MKNRKGIFLHVPWGSVYLYFDSRLIINTTHTMTLSKMAINQLTLMTITNWDYSVPASIPYYMMVPHGTADGTTSGTIAVSGVLNGPMFLFIYLFVSFNAQIPQL